MHASTFRISINGKIYRGEGRRVRILLPLALLLALCAAAVSAQAPNPPAGLSVDKTTTSDAGKASWTAVSGATAYIRLSFRSAQPAASQTLFPGNHGTQRQLQ